MSDEVAQGASEPQPSADPGPAGGRPGSWLAKAASGMIVAVGMLAMGEAVLRLLDVGGTDRFFLTETILGEPAWITNPRSARRLFPSRQVAGHQVHTPELGAMRFPLQKAGRFRVFVLGASSVQGFPEPPCFAIPAALQAILARSAPGLEVEVINCGVVATSSFAVLDLAEEVIKLQPDALVVYSGHNELHGVWGAASALRVGTGGRWLTRASQKLRRFRLVRLLTDRLERRAGEGLPRGELIEVIAGGQRVTSDGSAHRLAESNLRANLKAVLALASDAGVSCVLATPASNVAGLSPLAAGGHEVLAPEDRAAFDQALEDGWKLLETGDAAAAIQAFESARLSCPDHADAWFGLAAARRAAGRPQEAREAFLAARDRDQLHFRACSSLCDVIRGVVAQASGSGADVQLADVESTLADTVSDGLVDDRLFHEHVHPTIRGTLAIARIIATALGRTSGSAGRFDLSRADQLNESELLEYGPLDELRTAMIMRVFYDQSPFLASQQDRAQTLLRLDGRMREITRALSPSRREVARQLAAGELRGSGLQRVEGEILEQEGRLEAATRAYQRELLASPYDVATLRCLGRVQARLPKRRQEARRTLEAVLRLLPDDAETRALLAGLSSR